VAKTHRHSAIQTTQQTQDAALRPEWTGRRVFLPVSSEHSGSDGRGYRSDGRLSRPGTAIRPNATERLADVPPGDCDSDRDVAQPRSGRLSSRSTDDSVVTSPTQADGPGSGSSRGPNGTHSCCCLRRRPCRQPTYPGSRSSGLCALNLGAHCRALTQLDFSHGCCTLLNTSVLEHGLSHICLSREISSPVR